jgi:phytol kinase
LNQQLLGVAAVVAWLAIVVAMALLVRRSWPEQREWSRKVVHIGTGPVVLIAWWLGIDRLVAVPAAALVTVLTALNHRYRLLPAVEDVGRHSYGTIAYGAAITSLLLLFWPQKPLAVVAGVLVMAIGDGLAGLIGPLVASPRWQLLGQTKSLAGTLAMACASLGVLALLRPLAGADLAPPAAALLLMAAAATSLEQLSRYGLDNLSVPLATGLLWAGFTP